MDWLKNAGAALPEMLPRCLVNLVQRGMSSLLHAAAILFGLVFCGLSIWDVVVLKNAFAHVNFGAGAAAIQAAWGTLWLALRRMKTSGTIAEPEKETPDARTS